MTRIVVEKFSFDPIVISGEAPEETNEKRTVKAQSG
jgi:hypothetical protein